MNDANYLRWSQSVRMYLMGRGKICYITSDKKQPDKAGADYDTWDAENSMVMTWLVNSIDEEIGANYLCYDTAKELWECVSQMYSDLENQSQIYKLTLKLGEIRQGLNVNFDEVRGRILGRNPIPQIGEVFSEVRRKETRRQVMLGKNTAAVPPPVEGSTLEIPHVNHKPLPNQRGGDKTHLFCDYCGRNCHTRETCYKLHGRPNHGKTGKFGDHPMPTTNEADSSPCTKEQMDNLLNFLKFNSSLNIPIGTVAQTSKDSWTLSSHSYSNPWIIASGES
ncbi:hypothetical protein KIW84_074065 [Lathyrus oleraceus]|uniref:Retrotransposon Copia-like N-terminal domain-containing protein n=1 Tax=Pisum sativum TaxID=3888 RepID=A0A9D4VT22_PEA|nr:hypothetical protein KIW84_074065 [Pisum sativum]